MGESRLDQLEKRPKTLGEMGWSSRRWDNCATPPHGGTITYGVIPFEKGIALFSDCLFSLSTLMFLLPHCNNARLYFPGLSLGWQLYARTRWPGVLIQGLGTPH